MEVIGRLIFMLPERRGESARGPWASGGFVIETEEQFPRKIAFTVWGEDRLAAIKSIAIGNTIKVTFNIESREYNERWYTDCRCINVETFTSAMQQNPYSQPQQNYQMPPQNMQTGAGQTNVAPQVNYQAGQPMDTQLQNQQVQYQQPPAAPQSMGGTIETESMPQDDDDLPF